MSEDLDGWKKNWDVVKNELAAWKETRKPFVQELEDAKGIGEKAHKWHNLKHTEFVRACNRAAGYILLGVKVVFLVQIIAVILLLAFSPKAAADVRCKPFPWTGPGPAPIHTFTGKSCPMGYIKV